ncbi:MAG: GMP synthase [Gammaproteobacteria bacterium]|nr:GMP synthase [Gammaproteobacteria bacterium]
MKNYAVIQHTYSEFLGLIEAQLEKRDIGFSYIRPFVGQALPGSAMQFDALFLLAGAFPTTDDDAYPWVEDELETIGVFLDVERPIVGIGMGGLLVARYFGGTAHEEPMFNAYFTTARMTEAGKDDRVARALDGRRVLVMYNGSVDLAGGVEPILVDEAGKWIAARPDPMAYALLFRPEIKPGMLEDIVMEANHPVPDNMDELIAEARAEWPRLQQATDELVVALVKELDLMRERRKPPVFNLRIEQE